MSWLRAGPVSFAWALAGSLAGASGCGPVTAAERGAQLFQDPAFSPSPSNVFSCATCHRVADGAQRFAGPDLRGVVRRSPLWCGQYGYLLDAVNNCLGAFMRAEPLSPTDDRGRALLAYLQGLPGGSGAASPCTIVRVIDSAYLASLPSGDAGRGAAVYRDACQGCHGDTKTGDGRLGDRVSIIPNDTIASFGVDAARAVIAEKIRHGKFYGIGGVMPPYTQEALSDPELADILAYVLP